MSELDNYDWQQVYRDHGTSVLAYLRTRVPPSEAEDLLHDTFVRAIRAQNRSTGAPIDSFRPYLLTIARNLLANRLRDSRPKRELEEESTLLDEEHVEGASAAHQDADFRELETRIESALRRMSDDHRTAFELAVLQRRSYREVARKTGWSLSRVKVNVHRARQSAIAELADYLP